MKEYLLILTQEEHASLGTVRSLTNLQVAEDGHLYVRGIDEVTFADKRIKQLPVLHTYVLDEQERLFPLQGVTPVGKLQPLMWMPIATFIDIELPVSAMPARLRSKLTVRLIPANNTREGFALLTKLTTWKAYAETAPASRLEHLKFAAASNGDVVITGTPLPPVQGKEFYKEKDILLPAGYAFEVPIAADILLRKLHRDHSVLMFLASGDWYQIPAASFVKATRSAVRLTELINE